MIISTIPTSRKSEIFSQRRFSRAGADADDQARLRAVQPGLRILLLPGPDPVPGKGFLWRNVSGNAGGGGAPGLPGSGTGREFHLSGGRAHPGGTGILPAVRGLCEAVCPPRPAGESFHSDQRHPDRRGMGGLSEAIWIPCGSVLGWPGGIAERFAAHGGGGRQLFAGDGGDSPAGEGGGAVQHPHGGFRTRGPEGRGGVSVSAEKRLGLSAIHSLPGSHGSAAHAGFPEAGNLRPVSVHHLRSVFSGTFPGRRGERALV